MQAVDASSSEENRSSSARGASTAVAGEPPARAVSSLGGEVANSGGLVSDTEGTAAVARNNSDAGAVEEEEEEDAVQEQKEEEEEEPLDHVNKKNNDVSEDDEEQDDESEYEYEDDDDAAFGGFLAVPPAEQRHAPTRNEEEALLEKVQQESLAKPKWKEPSKEAVNMSLRAQQETSGGKRRLAQDLYKIMMSDTSEAGFSLSPSSEDSMDKWTIQLFDFDQDSNLHKDMCVLGVNHVELEMTFPDQYPFDPPFVRVVRPRFQRQTGFVMNGALCMELLTKDGWNPINDIESVIVSIRSLMVVGDGRLQDAVKLAEAKYKTLLEEYEQQKKSDGSTTTTTSAVAKRERSDSLEKKSDDAKKPAKISKPASSGGGQYTAAEAKSAYAHISDYHKKKGWDSSGWWAKKG